MTRNWKMEQPSRKLDYQMVGLYKVFKKISNLYKIELLDLIKVHLVFSLDKLWKATTDPLPGQKNKPPLPIQVNGNDEWEIEEILACKLVRGILKYRVSWKGYDLDPIWYFVWNFIGSPQKLQEFHSCYPNEPRPLKYLNEWMECWYSEDDKLPKEYKDKNAL